MQKQRTNLFIILVMTLGIFTVFSSGTGEESTPAVSEIIVYCYDSFAGDWGPGPALAERFTEETGITVNFVAPGDAVTVLAKAIMEKDQPRGDILIGPDNNLLARTLEEEILIPYESPLLDEVEDRFEFDETGHLLPFDWGYFAVCYDSEALETIPGSLEDLTKPEYEKSLILMDPRTSSPGMGFLLWTVAVYGDEFPDYWKRLGPSILTIAEGWSSGYGLFTAGEAPLVLSYSTSPVYHKMWEETDRYKALEFSEGNYIQIEGAGILKGGPNPEGAKQFIDFMLSPEGQEIIAANNIMMPVNPGTQLPEAFDMAFVSKKQLLLSKEEIAGNEELWIRKWIETMGF